MQKKKYHISRIFVTAFFALEKTKNDLKHLLKHIVRGEGKAVKNQNQKLVGLKTLKNCQKNGIRFDR